MERYLPFFLWHFMAFEYSHPGFSGKGFHLNDDFAPAL
jgi:hypothetical protein